MGKIIILINSVLAACLAICLLVYPGARGLLNTRDPALKDAGIPAAALRLARHLTPQYAKWARERVAGGRAKSMQKQDISGTEWPLFGSVFYLWAVENLQTAWDAGNHAMASEPRVFCKDAILAASDLVIDEGHATWVKSHWGTNYLHHENVFYRALLIAALTSRINLLQDNTYIGLLRDQVETLSTELNASKTGLLDDYPGECYPGDIMAAVMCIGRADRILGTDHSTFIKRSMRAFTGRAATKRGLPPYQADAKIGKPVSDTRGCGNSYFCLTAPELWPGLAKTWFNAYEKSFWQEQLGFVGFREFAQDSPKSDWHMNVDSGPIIDGFGVAANAFGAGAARKNGRFDLAYPLSLEMLTASWELPGGTLAMPRLLSNLSDAPLLGEAAILWLLTIQPQPGFPVKAGGSIPVFVYAVTISALLLGLLALDMAANRFWTTWKQPAPLIPRAGLQMVIWMVLIVGAVAAFALNHGLIALAAALGAVMFPRNARAVDSDEEPAKPQIT